MACILHDIRGGNQKGEQETMQSSHFPRRQAGFTLIEIAIVLVIIGLLLGGILKGQELINSARVKSLATDFRNVPVYIYGYQDRFRAIPGDDPAVVAHLGANAQPASKGTQGNGLIEGAWGTGDKETESYLFWQHVRLAGLASGATDTDANEYPPRNTMGGRIGIQGVAPYDNMAGTYFVCSAGISGRFAKQLDMQLDDGNTASGSMMAGNAALNPNPPASVAPTDTEDIDDSTTYTVCMGV